MGLFSKKPSNGTGLETSELVRNFIMKSEGLQRILEKETEYFRQMKTKQAEMLIEAKLELISEIEEIKAGLIGNPDVIVALPASEKQRLKAANASLMAAAEDNYSETLKAKEVNKLILEAIADAVNHSKRVDGAYGDKGTAYKVNDEATPIAIIQNA